MVLWVVVASCGSDPLSDVRAPIPRSVGLSTDTLVVPVGDSLAVRVVVFDGDSNRIAVVPTVTSLTTALEVVAIVEGSDPDSGVYYDAWLRGKQFGTGRILVSADPDDLVNNVFIAKAWPARLEIGGLPPRVTSLQRVPLVAVALDAAGGEIVVPQQFEWTAFTSRATVDSEGVATAREPGRARVQVNGFGLSATVSFDVHPTTFPGNISARSVALGEIVVFEDTIGFDFFLEVGYQDVVEIEYGRRRASFFYSDTLAGRERVVLAFADGYHSVDTLEILSDSIFDVREPNNVPAVALAIDSASWTTVLTGPCDQGIATTGTSDCDDLFVFPNDTQDTVSVVTRLDWFSDMDVNILWTTSDFGRVVESQGGLGFNVGYRAHAEVSVVDIPPATTRILWISGFKTREDLQTPVLVRLNRVP